MRVAVVIPSFRAAASIAGVLDGIGPEVDRIYVIDDGCPDATAEVVLRRSSDPRVAVLRNRRNLGVGGAMKIGYAQALRDGAGIVVKLDADGQMDPAQISRLIRPIVEGRSDYAKGNRFAPHAKMPEGSAACALSAMPLRRRLANRLLSAVHRAVTGYWTIGDPANGYTAIHAGALRRIDLEAVADCFFFETDMLFALNLAGAVVADVPLPARYSTEVSNLKLRRVAPRFSRFIVERFAARMARKYLSNRFSPGSVALGLGVLLLVAAAGFGGWSVAGGAGSALTWASTSLLLALVSLGAAFLYDIVRQPRVPLARCSRQSR